jgi:diguanylate cyclase (GGDEF)-like protein
MKKEKILILELNEKNFEVLNSLLIKHEYTPICVIDRNSFMEAAKREEEYDLIIVNAHIQYASIKDVKELSNSHETSSEFIPIVYIDSAKEHDKTMLEECFSTGVSDYLKKPFDAKEIVARVKHHIEIGKRLREYKLRLDKLANLATIDQLSKSTSKMHMQAILKHELSNYKRYKKDTSLIYLGIINIEKFINTFGLEKGEKHIANFAKFLRLNIRESDVLARWVGAEFLILLTNTNAKTAESVVRKIKVMLANDAKLAKEQIELAFGITQFKSDDTFDEVIERVKYTYSEARKQTYGKLKVA